MTGTLRLVPSAVAEEASRLLKRTHLDNERLPEPPIRGRIVTSSGPNRLGSHDLIQVRAQGVYLRSVSIVEAFVDSLTSDLFSSRVSGLDIFFTKLSDAVLVTASQTWDGRKAALQHYHDVSIGNLDAWGEFAPCIVVRNAIAHGLGELTPRQRNSKDRATVRSTGTRLAGDRLVVDKLALRQCRDKCAKLIYAVDRLVSEAGRRP